MPFTIEMLMTTAATGALVIDAAEEAALLMFVFAVGEVLEGVAANKARDRIRALARLVPKTALVEVSGKTREAPATSLRIGQTVLVRPGDRAPADDEVTEGVSGVDESPITVESVPNLKEPGQPVFAGSINTEAALRVQVTKAAEHNTIARIIRLVEEAEDARAPTERFIDRFSRICMTAVVGLALMVAIALPLAFCLRLGHAGVPRAGAFADRPPLRAGDLAAGLHRLGAVGGGAARAIDEGRRGRRSRGANHACGL
jgi:Cd2+/Zn2+-exporting ATPase